MHSNSSKVYFPGLNGLRFLAAFAVIVTHIELMKKYFNMGHLWEDSAQVIKTFPLDHILAGELNVFQPLVSDAGPLGVTFFFVLSGFLITYLLYVERDNTGHIGVKKFYMRRILRIWPLYFIVLLLGFFVLPHIGDWFYVRDQSEGLTENYWINLVLYFFIFPNLAYSITGRAVPCIGQSWSIGVEEQFYLLWPVLIKFARKPFNIIIYATGGLVALKALTLLVWSLVDVKPQWLIVVKELLAMSKFECMTIGAMGAWVIFYRHRGILNFITSRPVEIGAYLGSLLLLYLIPASLQDGVHLVYGILFLIIMINVSCNKKGILKLENRTWNFLGKISYGLYMYHLIIITFSLHFIERYMPGQSNLPLWVNLLLYATVIGLTIFVSALSYRYIEKPFIRNKSRHTRVVSGEDARVQT